MTERPLEQLLNADPDFLYTEDQAEADGVIVRMDAWGAAHFRDGRIGAVSRDLHAALRGLFAVAIELGSIPSWAVLGDLLEYIVRPGRVHDTAVGVEEPHDHLYSTEPLAVFGGRPVWVERSGVNWTAMFPEDY